MTKKVKVRHKNLESGIHVIEKKVKGYKGSNRIKAIDVLFQNHVAEVDEDVAKELIKDLGKIVTIIK